MKKNSFVGCTMMFLLLHATPSQAQTSGTAGDVELPETVVKGRLPEDSASVDFSDSYRIPLTAFEMPMMTSFISSELNLLQANQTIEDARRNAAGVTTGSSCPSCFSIFSRSCRSSVSSPHASCMYAVRSPAGKSHTFRKIAVRALYCAEFTNPCLRASGRLARRARRATCCQRWSC